MKKDLQKEKNDAKAKKTGNGKLRTKFEYWKREIKADIKKQHDLYVNNLVGDVKANPGDFYRYINRKKKTDTQTRYFRPSPSPSLPLPRGEEMKWSCRETLKGQMN